jgi:hypothetical protein
MGFRYEDNSEAFLRSLVDSDILPAVEAMGDLTLEEIRGGIPLGEGPAPAGGPPASPPPAHVMYRSWLRSTVRRRGDTVSCIVLSRARAANGESLVLVHEQGRDDVPPRPTIGPGFAAAKTKLLFIARQFIR